MRMAEYIIFKDLMADFWTLDTHTTSGLRLAGVGNDMASARPSPGVHLCNGGEVCEGRLRLGRGFPLLTPIAIQGRAKQNLDLRSHQRLPRRSSLCSFPKIDGHGRCRSS